MDHVPTHRVVFQTTETQRLEEDKTILQVRCFCKDCNRFLQAGEIAIQLNLDRLARYRY